MCPNTKIDLVISETDKAYTAGIIDGEGCITISLRKNIRQRAYGIQHVLQVHVKMCNRQAIDFLKQKFGGYTYLEKPSGIGTKPAYHWSINGKDALSCLILIFPYLQVKKAQSKVGIDFQLGFPKQRHPLSKLEFERREKHFKTMRELKNSEQ